jgi:hypothetical protein
MARELMHGRGRLGIRVLDPCVGPGTFCSALSREGLLRRADTFVGLDIDQQMVSAAMQSAVGLQASTEFHVADFLTTEVGEADYVIMNPPYVRQEWLDSKVEYADAVLKIVDAPIPGTANLYAYFIVKAVGDLVPGGRLACVVYDSWQYTRFGRWLRDALSDLCDDIRVESAGQQPFQGHLIDATILYGTKRRGRHGTYRWPAQEEGNTKPGFARLEDLFQTRRGLRLKQASFFGCRRDDCEKLGASPFLKKVGAIQGYKVPDDHSEAAILVFGPDTNPVAHEVLRQRLDAAKHAPEANATILNWYEQRPDAWMYHRPPPWAPLVFNYYLRNRPRHILNATRPFSDNFYGLSPRSDEVDAIPWLAILNSSIVADGVMAHSRNQGNGLSKIQLFEYRRVPVPDATLFSSRRIRGLTVLGNRLVNEPDAADEIVSAIDHLLYDTLGDATLADANGDSLIAARARMKSASAGQ